MEIWSEIRRDVLTGGLSKRAAIAQYGISWHTLTKTLAHDRPPGYRRVNQRPMPKPEWFLSVVRQILEDDGKAPTKQKHTAHRIFESLRDEHGHIEGRDGDEVMLFGSIGSATARCFCRFPIHRERPRWTLARRRCESLGRRRRQRSS